MSMIKGVMLMTMESESYRRHNAYHTSIAKENTGAKTPDPKQKLTLLVEERVRQEMQHQFLATNYRILRWEQLDHSNRFIVRFRELDGVFMTDKGVMVLLEVKASASKSGLKSGLEQLRAAVNTATRVHQHTVGILVIADLGEWFEMFGRAATLPLADYFTDMNLELINWPPTVPCGKTNGICVALIPSQSLMEWIPMELDEDLI